jgi:STE24 endopeptidase
VVRGRSRLPLALLTALVVAEAAVLLLRPRHGVIEPAPVRAESYFSPSEIERARDYRRPQLALFAGGLVVQAGVLLLLVRRPPRQLRRRWRRPYVAAAATGATLAVVLTVAPLPIDAVARQRAIDVGLVTQSWGGWAVDLAKSTAISAAFAAGAAALVIALMRRFSRHWWLPAAGAAVAVSAAFQFAAPVLLDPVFNRFDELPAGRTRSDVLDIARRAGIKVDHVYVVDASRRTTAANAYVTGLGATKRVVLYDNLVRNFSRDETRLVVAHEIAHVRYDDVPRGLLYLALVAPAGMFAVSMLTRALAGWGLAGARRARPHFALPLGDGGAPSPRVLPAVALSLGLVTGATTVISNTLSRRVEARADSFALRVTGAAEPFISFERRIALRNVTDPDPPAWIQALVGTHPSIVQRIGIARAYEERAGGSGDSR